MRIIDTETTFLITTSERQMNLDRIAIERYEIDAKPLNYKVEKDILQAEIDNTETDIELLEHFIW